MFEFLEYALSMLKQGLMLGVLVAIPIGLILAITCCVHRKKYGNQRRFPWGTAVCWLLLAGYLAVVIYVTLLRGDYGYRSWNLHLFRAWREAWNDFSAKNWANVLLNVAMFLPLGVLLPLIWKKFRKWYLSIPVGFGVSLAIELVQLAAGRGLFDVDDLFCNTLGGIIGYLGVMTVISLFGEKRKKAGIVYGCTALGCILGICSIFVCYHVQEYGNLPDAAAYRTDMRNIQWTLSCDLPEVESRAPVYQNQKRTIADCDAFAAEFETIIGTRLDDISYYQEAAYYLCHGGENGVHFLFVHYLDTGYEYQWIDHTDPVWVDGSREDLVSALEKYPVHIPDYAEFNTEGEGWHSFTVDKWVDGATMTDGTLRCRYAADGTVKEIKNDLLTYTYYDTVEIISPEEACEKLCSGDFSAAETVLYYAQDKISIVSCRLGYSVDTKAFYQPVYLFVLEIPGQEGSFQAMIPGIR